MKITSIEPQKKNSRRFNIFLDGQFAFGADEDLVVEHRLIPGKMLDLPLINKLLLEAEVGKLIEKMYRWLGIRQRSEKEARDYFRIKNLEFRIKGKDTISDLSVESVITALKRKGILNDLEFARAWIDARSKKKGLRVIKQELFQKGISKEIVEQITDNELQAKNEAEVVTRLILKKINSWKNLEPLKLKKKAYDFLLQRGFEYEVIREIVEKVIKREYN